MPFTVSCPNPECNKVLRAPDGTDGKKVLCKACRTVFRVSSGPQNEPQMSAPDVVGNRITSILQGLGQWRRYYLVPQIPQEKLRNAVRRCNVPSSDGVLGLIDCTFWGSAKKSIVFGRNALYYNNFGRGALLYEDLPGRVFGVARPGQLSLGNGEQLCLAEVGCTTEKFMAVLQSLKKWKASVSDSRTQSRVLRCPRCRSMEVEFVFGQSVGGAFHPYRVAGTVLAGAIGGVIGGMLAQRTDCYRCGSCKHEWPV